MGLPGPCSFDQDASHDARSHAQEMGAVLPVDVGVGQAQVGFVNQEGRLEGVPRRFATQLLLSQLPKLGVDKGNQPVVCALVAAPPLLE